MDFQLKIGGNPTFDLLSELPYCLNTIRVENFRGIQKIELLNIPNNAQWFFLTGENSYGKTTLLKTIAIRFQQFFDKENLLVSPEEKGMIIIGIITSKIDYRETEKGELITNIPIATYGPSRLTLQQPDAKNEIGRRSTTTYSLFNSDGILLNIEAELLLWKLEKDPRFETVKNLIKNIVPDLHDIVLEGRDVLYIEKDENGNLHQPMPFDKLAAGYRSIIAMVGDMYLRLSKHQIDKEPKELGGIVLIDELDVHLHPKWQRALPGLLSKAFPKVQFIASTHSPIPFLGAPKNSVFIKVNRTKEEGITAERLDIDVTNLTPNLILTSPIFGMDFITSVNMEKVDDIETEDSYEELKNNEETKKRLQELYKSGKTFPDELFEKANK